MDTIIIGIDWKHYQYFTERIITAKEKITKRAILIPGIWAKIRTMIGCSNSEEKELEYPALYKDLPRYPNAKLVDTGRQVRCLKYLWRSDKLIHIILVFGLFKAGNFEN